MQFYYLCFCQKIYCCCICCCGWVSVVLTLDHWGDVLISLTLGPWDWSSHLVWPSLLETGDRWRGVKGPGKYPIQSSPPTSGWWRCGVLKRSLLTNRSLLLHLYMQVMIFSIWNNYIICTVVVSKTSITNTRQSGSQLSLWLQLKLIWQRLRLY